jgi:hypothetical protein
MCIVWDLIGWYEETSVGMTGRHTHTNTLMDDLWLFHFLIIFCMSQMERKLTLWIRDIWTRQRTGMYFPSSPFIDTGKASTVLIYLARPILCTLALAAALHAGLLSPQCVRFVTYSRAIRGMLDTSQLRNFCLSVSYLRPKYMNLSVRF